MKHFLSKIIFGLLILTNSHNLCISSPEEDLMKKIKDGTVKDDKAFEITTNFLKEGIYCLPYPLYPYVQIISTIAHKDKNTYMGKACSLAISLMKDEKPANVKNGMQLYYLLLGGNIHDFKSWLFDQRINHEYSSWMRGNHEAIFKSLETYKTQKENQRQALAAGIEEYLTKKGIDRQDFIQKINKYMLLIELTREEKLSSFREIIDQFELSEKDTSENLIKHLEEMAAAQAQQEPQQSSTTKEKQSK